MHVFREIALLIAVFGALFGLVLGTYLESLWGFGLLRLILLCLVVLICAKLLDLSLDSRLLSHVSVCCYAAKAQKY